MNQNLNEALFDVAKLDALMAAIEYAYIGVPKDQKTVERAASAFYALWDIIEKLSGDLDRLAEDCTIVNVIQDGIEG